MENSDTVPPVWARSWLLIPIYEIGIAGSIPAGATPMPS